MLEIGNGEFFPSLAKNIGPIAIGAGIIIQSEFDNWIEAMAVHYPKTGFSDHVIL